MISSLLYYHNVYLLCVTVGIPTPFFKHRRKPGSLPNPGVMRSVTFLFSDWIAAVVEFTLCLLFVTLYVNEELCNFSNMTPYCVRGYS